MALSEGQGVGFAGVVDTKTFINVSSCSAQSPAAALDHLCVFV
jgi:hypothetical protein